MFNESQIISASSLIAIVLEPRDRILHGIVIVLSKTATCATSKFTFEMPLCYKGSQRAVTFVCHIKSVNK